MRDKEKTQGAEPLELGRATEQSGASDTDYEELLAKIQELQEQVQVMGPIDPNFDTKRFSDELEK